MIIGEFPLVGELLDQFPCGFEQNGCPGTVLVFRTHNPRGRHCVCLSCGFVVVG